MSPGELDSNILEYVYEKMQIDDEWSVREARQFTWWGHVLAQRVWADPIRESQGVDVTSLHAETVLLDNVEIDERTLGLVSQLNRHATLSSFILNVHSKQLVLHAAVYVHDEIAYLLRELFLHAVALQVAEAHRYVDSIRESFDGEIAVSSHPTRGARGNADGMLRVMQDVYIPRGTEPSCVPTEELEAIASMDPTPVSAAVASEKSFTAELPFSGSEDSPADRGGAQEAILRMDGSEPHFELGYGCTIRLTLPVSTLQFELVNSLSWSEVTEWTGCHLIGGWWWDHTNENLCFNSFLPNAAYLPGMCSLLLWSIALRSTRAFNLIGE